MIMDWIAIGWSFAALAWLWREPDVERLGRCRSGVGGCRGHRGRSTRLIFGDMPFNKKTVSKTASLLLLGLTALSVPLLPTPRVQTFNALSDATTAAENAVKQTRSEFPALAWAFDELEKCDKGLGEYSNPGYRLRANCDFAVTERAKKRGAEVELAKAFQRREKLAQDNHPDIPWPLSML